MNTPIIPDPNCSACPRLVQFRNDTRLQFPDWHNAPVPSFGPLTAELLIIGLAPGLRGANRTGRPFTADYAGDLLYSTLINYGFATGPYDRRSDDGLCLVNARITNAVRCVPPENKPTGQEITTCRQFLTSELTSLPSVRVIVALGRIAHESVLRTLNLPLSKYPFGHNKLHRLTDHLSLVDSYHCSRYNTSTGRLTESMFHEVFKSVLAALKKN